MHVAARSEDEAKTANEDLNQVTGKEAIWLKLDLASLQSIKDAAEEFPKCVRRNDSGQARSDSRLTRKETELHVLSITRTFAFPSQGSN